MKKPSLTRSPALRRRNPVRRAFTLMEIIIVIALIGGIIIAIVPQLVETFGEAQESTEKTKIETTLNLSLVRFMNHMGTFPTTEEGLQVLFTRPEVGGDRWRGPYVKDADVLFDAWRRPYQYQYPGTHNPKGYDLWSEGPPTNPRQIGNWK